MHNRGLAIDKSPSKRSYDSDGKLKIKDCNLTMEQVAGYYGYEIPGYKSLGLQPDKMYKLYRPKDELLKAIDSFSGQPVLNDHHDTEVDKIDPATIVGYVVSQPYFEYPFLKADITIHDLETIKKLENNIQRELSPQYYWKPDMTPGEFNGEPYDGVMRGLEALNVALVDQARAGSANKVSDSEPKTTGGDNMNVAQELEALMKKVNDASPEDKAAFEAKFKEHQGGEIGDIKLEIQGLKDAIAKLVDGKSTASDEEPEKKDDEQSAKDSEISELRQKVADMEARKKADDEKAEAQEVTKEVISKASDSATALDIYKLAAKELGLSDVDFERAKANDALPFFIKTAIELDKVKKQHQEKANDSVSFGGGDYQSGMAKLLGGAK